MEKLDLSRLTRRKPNTAVATPRFLFPGWLAGYFDPDQQHVHQTSEDSWNNDHTNANKAVFLSRGTASLRVMYAKTDPCGTDYAWVLMCRDLTRPRQGHVVDFRKNLHFAEVVKAAETLLLAAHQKYDCDVFNIRLHDDGRLLDARAYHASVDELMRTWRSFPASMT